MSKKKIKKCTKCTKFPCMKGMRFCSRCRGIVWKEMVKTNYLETRHMYGYLHTYVRNDDHKEITEETKGGISDDSCHQDDFGSSNLNTPEEFRKDMFNPHFIVKNPDTEEQDIQ